MEGNLRFKIDWPSLAVGSKFTVFALFYFVFEGNFQLRPSGGLIFGGAIQRRGFSVTSFGGRAFIWRALFSVLDSKGRKTELKLILSKGILMTTGAPNENIVQNHLNIALLNVF